LEQLEELMSSHSLEEVRVRARMVHSVLAAAARRSQEEEEEEVIDLK